MACWLRCRSTEIRGALNIDKFIANLRSPTWQRTLYIMFVAQMLTSLGFSMTFPFLPLYVESLGSTTGIDIEFWVGMVFSAQAITMMIASPIWGAIADRYGRKLMVQRATYGGAAIIVLMAFVTSAEQLVLLRAIQGFITGMVSAANALVAGVAPRERIGYAMGLLQVGLWSGIAVGPLIGGALADAHGYAMPFVVTAVLLVLAGVLVHVGVEENLTPTQKQDASRHSYMTEWRHVLSMRGVMLTYSLRFLVGLMRSMISPIAPLFMQVLLGSQSGVSTMTGLMVGLGSATATVTAIYLGRLGDRIGHRKIVIGSAIAAGLLFLPTAFAKDAWQLILLYALAGAATGGLVASPSALLAQFTDPGEEGAVYGIDNSIVAAARAISPLVAAALAVWFGYRGVFVVVALIPIALVLVAGRGLHERQLTTA